jgi:hypothetical protein
LQSSLDMHGLTQQQLQELTLQNETLKAENSKLTEDMKVMTTNLFAGDEIGKRQMAKREGEFKNVIGTVRGDLDVRTKELADVSKLLREKAKLLEDVRTRAHSTD